MNLNITPVDLRDDLCSECSSIYVYGRPDSHTSTNDAPNIFHHIFEICNLVQRLLSVDNGSSAAVSFPPSLQGIYGLRSLQSYCVLHEITSSTTTYNKPGWGFMIVSLNLWATSCFSPSPAPSIRYGAVRPHCLVPVGIHLYCGCNYRGPWKIWPLEHTRLVDVQDLRLAHSG